jgi:hypothetical protein
MGHKLPPLYFINSCAPLVRVSLPVLRCIPRCIFRHNAPRISLSLARYLLSFFRYHACVALSFIWFHTAPYVRRWGVSVGLSGQGPRNGPRATQRAKGHVRPPASLETAQVVASLTQHATLAPARSSPIFWAAGPFFRPPGSRQACFNFCLRFSLHTFWTNPLLHKREVL